MAEFQEVMKIRQIMCNCDNYDECRAQCPLSSANNKHEVICTEFICYYPKEAEKIIMKWSEKHLVSDFVKREV